MIAITEPSVYGSADTKKVYHFIDILYGFNFMDCSLAISCQTAWDIFFLFLKTQKIDNGTRIYQVNCTVIF